MRVWEGRWPGTHAGVEARQQRSALGTLTPTTPAGTLTPTTGLPEPVRGGHVVEVAVGVVHIAVLHAPGVPGVLVHGDL